MNKRSRRLLGWAVQDVVQYGSFVLGAYYEVGWVTWIGVILTWATSATIFAMCIRFTQISYTYATERKRMDVGDSPVPWVLDLILDSLFCALLWHTGWEITAAAYAAHTVLVPYLRAASRRYNAGLVVLVDHAESKLPPLKEGA